MVFLSLAHSTALFSDADDEPLFASIPQQIIATRPKGIRRTSSRRGGAKGQVLGNRSTAPATRARAAPASNGAKVVSAVATAPQPADKIMVSNLPPDVNEAQVKVSAHDNLHVGKGLAHDLSL